MTTTDTLTDLFGGDQPLTLLANLLNENPACQLADAELFTGPDTDEPDLVRQARETRAKAICAGCPARAACLDYALTIRPRDGVWAGYTAEQIDGLAALSTRFDLCKEVA